MGDDFEAPQFRIRVTFGPGKMLGPGKAELLERIARTGSIAAAGRAMNMSYKRAWMLVDTMNAMFAEPVVSSTRGGPTGGGAEVTECGMEILRQYRALEQATVDATSSHVSAIQSRLRDMSERK